MGKSLDDSGSIRGCEPVQESVRQRKDSQEQRKMKDIRCSFAGPVWPFITDLAGKHRRANEKYMKNHRIRLEKYKKEDERINTAPLYLCSEEEH